MKGRVIVPLVALAMVALASAIPAWGSHGQGLYQKVSAALSTGPVTVNAIQQCKTDESGNAFDCQPFMLDPIPVQDLGVALEYTLAGAAHLPTVQTKAGTRGCTFEDKTTGAKSHKPGVTLLALGGNFHPSSKVQVTVNGQEQAVPGPPSRGVDFVATAICLGL